MANNTYEALLPEITALNKPFWDGCNAGELRLQQCGNCDKYRYPESPLCPSCLSEDYIWTPASGRGTLWSWIVMHQSYFSALADTLPYNVAFIELDEGPFMMSGLENRTENIECGTKVRAVFRQVAGGRSIVKFQIEQ